METTMRKRLQRVRDKLRREIEMTEQRHLRPEDMPRDLPAKVVELLARPRLTDLPENPVGCVAELLRKVYAEFNEVDLQRPPCPTRWRTIEPAADDLFS
jgi:hypothetical protein